jgi:hypothetical protein
MKRFLQLAILATILISILLVHPSTVSAAPNLPQIDGKCGSGSEADNYGFTYDLNQPHWTVGNGLVSEETMAQVDVTLDQLNADQLAQTMILVLPENQVGEPVNCAVHFLRYMGLGLVDGPHADNGFVWLFVVRENSVEVRYGVGLGLPALTAPGLGDLKRLGVDTFDTTKSVDASILAVVQTYDTYVRSEYAITPVTTESSAEESTLPTPINNGSGGSILLFLFLCFVGIIIFAVLASLFSGLFGGNTTSTSSDYTPSSSYRPSSSSPSSSSSYRPSSSSSSRPSSSSSSSRPSSSPPSRGGSGSGRSNRGG